MYMLRGDLNITIKCLSGAISSCLKAPPLSAEASCPKEASSSRQLSAWRSGPLLELPSFGALRTGFSVSRLSLKALFMNRCQSMDHRHLHMQLPWRARYIWKNSMMRRQSQLRAHAYEHALLKQQYSCMNVPPPPPPLPPPLLFLHQTRTRNRQRSL